MSWRVRISIRSEQTFRHKARQWEYVDWIESNKSVR